VDRHGRIGSKRLSAEGVCLVVRERVQAGGIDPKGYSGHSLRSGLGRVLINAHADVRFSRAVYDAVQDRVRRTEHAASQPDRGGGEGLTVIDQGDGPFACPYDVAAEPCQRAPLARHIGQS
jgi:hypothetical protein